MTHQEHATHTFYSQMKETLRKQVRNVARPLHDKLPDEIKHVIDLVEEGRLPRIAIVGRRGAGKSMLLNAIFEQQVCLTGAIRPQTGQTAWQTYTGPRDEPLLDVLDTRGFQEAFQPQEADTATTSEKSIQNAFRQAIPDVIVFVVKATEVNAAINADIKALLKLLKHIHKEHGFYPVVIGVLMQCDTVDPQHIKTARDRANNPDAWEEKQRNINQARADLQRHFAKHAILRDNQKYIAVSAYVRFRPDGTLDPDPNTDWRWNIEELKQTLITEIPDDARLKFSRSTRMRHYQATFARRVVEYCTTASHMLGSQPIPLVDKPALATVQFLMVTTIAYMSGRSLSLQTARDFLAASGIHKGVGSTIRETARVVFRLLPGNGRGWSGRVAAAVTHEVGKLAIRYFIQGASIEEIQKEGKKFHGRVYRALSNGATTMETRWDGDE